MKSLIDSVLRTAIILVVVVVLLRWSWTHIQPLLPIIGLVVVIFVVVRAISAYRRYW